MPENTTSNASPILMTLAAASAVVGAVLSVSTPIIGRDRDIATQIGQLTYREEDLVRRIDGMEKLIKELDHSQQGQGRKIDELSVMLVRPAAGGKKPFLGDIPQE